MSKLFWIPFATGVFHGIAQGQKKEPEWGITNSILGINALYQAGFRFNEEWNLKPEHTKYKPHTLAPHSFFFGTIGSAFIVTGSIFCIGHLLTKKAYPLFKDDVN